MTTEVSEGLRSDIPTGVVRELSDRLVDIQAPIRVLDAVKWDDGVRDTFFADEGRQPPVDAEYYASRPLGFDPDEGRAALDRLEADIVDRLGRHGPAAQLLSRTAGQYRRTLDLLEARGRPEFGPIAEELYGTTGERFHPGGPTVEHLSQRLRTVVGWVDADVLDDDVHDIPGPEAVAVLQAQLDASLGPGLVHVLVDDGIVADAAAGSDYIKLRSDAWFSQRQLDQLEAHEGWVHVATSVNGSAQPACTFLGKATPTTTVTQEGLATLTELLTMRSHPARLLRIANRIDAIAMAGDGATFLDVYRMLRSDGLDRDEAWQTASRVFRGSTPTGPPFTKDLAYGIGLVLTYAYLRIAVREGRPDRIPMLFCGKVDLFDMGLVNELFDADIVIAPEHVPAPFHDPKALIASVAFSGFLRELDFGRLRDQFGDLL